MWKKWFLPNVLVLALLTGYLLTEQDAPREEHPPYARDLYGGWTDADGDCQDTRQEVLLAESLTPPELDARGCRVVRGLWRDPFTGQEFSDPGKLDIDHMVPLSEAHRSGAHAWPAAKKREYANDLRHPEALIAVSRSANRSKGDRDPSDWLPDNAAYVCDYVRNWVAVKTAWSLTMDVREEAAVNSIIDQCKNER